MKKKVRKAKTGKAKGKCKPVNVFEKKIDELDKLVPFRSCYVCEREGRDLMMIGPGKFRHQDCNPGSPNWLDYFERLKEKDKTDAGQMIYDHSRKG